MVKKLTSSLLLIFLTATLATAQLKVAHIFGNHMILQREKPVSVWGWANKGDKVDLTFNQERVSAKADATANGWPSYPPCPPEGRTNW